MHREFRHWYELCRKAADVYVCAPDGQRSAKSHSVTLGQPVTIQPVNFPYAKEAYQTSGSPQTAPKSDCSFEEAGIKIDMVYSGINMGSNLGRDTLYSEPWGLQQKRLSVDIMQWQFPRMITKRHTLTLLVNWR